VSKVPAYTKFCPTVHDCMPSILFTDKDKGFSEISETESIRFMVCSGFMESSPYILKKLAIGPERYQTPALADTFHHKDTIRPPEDAFLVYKPPAKNDNA
jgi:hypothetical protein